MKENSLRFFKVIIWRVCAFLITGTIIYFTTGDFAIAISVGLFEIVIKTITHFYFEIFWERITSKKTGES